MRKFRVAGLLIAGCSSPPARPTEAATVDLAAQEEGEALCKAGWNLSAAVDIHADCPMCGNRCRGKAQVDTSGKAEVRGCCGTCRKMLGIRYNSGKVVGVVIQELTRPSCRKLTWFAVRAGVAKSGGLFRGKCRSCQSAFDFRVTTGERSESCGMVCRRWPFAFAGCGARATREEGATSRIAGAGPGATSNQGVIDVMVEAWIPDATIQAPPGSGYDYFYGDGRGLKKHGSARMSHWLKIQLAPGGGVTPLDEKRGCGETYGLSRGKLYKATAPTTKMTSKITTSGTDVIIKINGAANNPLVKGSPDVDCYFTLRLRVVTLKNGQRRIHCWLSGQHDGFPNYWVWVGPQNLHVHEHKLGSQSPWSLAGWGEWKVAPPANGNPTAVVNYPE